jgi:hypothetical protein
MPPVLLLAEAPPPQLRARLSTTLHLGSVLHVSAVLLGEWPRGQTLTLQDDGLTDVADGRCLPVLDIPTSVELLRLCGRPIPVSRNPRPRPLRRRNPRRPTRVQRLNLPRSPISPNPPRRLGGNREDPAARGCASACSTCLPSSTGTATRCQVCGTTPPNCCCTSPSTAPAPTCPTLWRRSGHKPPSGAPASGCPPRSATCVGAFARPPATPPSSRLSTLAATTTWTPLLDIDAWVLTDALQQAAATSDPAVSAAALRRAVDAHAGILAEGCDYDWLEQPREQHRRYGMRARLGPFSAPLGVYPCPVSGVSSSSRARGWGCPGGRG